MSVNEIKVLHVLVCLDRGGVEMLLLNLQKELPEHISFDFLVHHNASRDHEALARGSKIHVVPPDRRSPLKLPELVGELVEKHHYDVVHFHRFAMGGRVLKEAKKKGASVRIAHSHHILLQEQSWKKKLFYYPYHYTLNRFFLARNATNILACSRDALKFLMGPWVRLHKCQVVLNGISLEDFSAQMHKGDRASLCKEFGIPENAKVIGHFGRLEKVKNQMFLLKIFEVLARKDSRYVLFIGGEGGLRSELEREIKRMNLEKRVFMPGSCENAPELYGNLFDCFCLPSIAEGFGIVLIEAVAAGLCSVCSDLVPKDIAAAFPERIVSLPLSAPPEKWAEQLESAIIRKSTPEEYLRIIEDSPMNFKYFCRTIIDMYEKAHKRQ